jgi:hypothetical protein
LDRICYEHLKELASIGRGKIACLVKVFSNSQFGQLYDLESAPSPRKKHRPHNKTDDEIVDDVILFQRIFKWSFRGVPKYFEAPALSC